MFFSPADTSSLCAKKKGYFKRCDVSLVWRVCPLYSVGALLLGNPACDSEESKMLIRDSVRAYPKVILCFPRTSFRFMVLFLTWRCDLRRSIYIIVQTRFKLLLMFLRYSSLKIKNNYYSATCSLIWSNTLLFVGLIPKLGFWFYFMVNKKELIMKYVLLVVFVCRLICFNMTEKKKKKIGITSYCTHPQ